MVIWKYIAENEPINQAELISKVANYYEIEPEIIGTDVSNFIASLYEKGLIEYGRRDISRKNMRRII